MCFLARALIVNFSQTTSETYGSAQYTPIDEDHPSVGQSPYSATKIAADQLAISYYRSFGLPVKIARPFNTYGPRQSSRAIIPTIITQLIINKSVSLGNTSPTRDFTYVTDTCNGIINILNSKKLYGEEINIGYGEEISMGELYNVICELMGNKLEIKNRENRKRKIDSEVNQLICNNNKIKSNTNWKIENSLKVGLSKTIKWFENPENLRMYKTNQYNV